MIEIRYTAPDDLDISGTVDELQTVRREILNLIESDIEQISFATDLSFAPLPYETALAKLVVIKGECPTKVSLKDEKEIQVEGTPDCLESFASFFNFKPDVEGSAHSHFEYYEGNEWVAPDSVPLVISVKL